MLPFSRKSTSTPRKEAEMSTSVATRIVLSGITDTGVTGEVAKIVRECGYSLPEDGPVEVIITNDIETARRHLQQIPTSRVVLLCTGSNDELEEAKVAATALSGEYPGRIQYCGAPEFRETLSKSCHFFRRGD